MIINYRKYSKMKKILSPALLILICLIFFSLTGCSIENQKQGGITSSMLDQECLPAPAGLVAWWPGDGNVEDIAGGNKSSLNGEATFVNGKVGKAFSFDGRGDFVNIPNTADLDITKQITLDSWIKANTFDLPIIAGETDDSNIYVISKDSNTGRSYGIAVTDFDAQPPFGCGPGGPHAAMVAFTSGGIAVACSSATLDTGVFYHLAGTYDSSTGKAKIYVDGNLAGVHSVTAGSLIYSTSADVQIGARQFTNFRAFFNGMIDEVGIFDDVLDAGQIKAMFVAGTAGKCKDEEF